MNLTATSAKPTTLTSESTPDKIIDILSELYQKQILLEDQIACLVADNILLEERVITLEENSNTQ